MSWLKELSLDNFRNQDRATFAFSPRSNLILGVNTVGKTNILEAVYLLSSGKSFRAEASRQMISWGKSFSLVEGEVVNDKSASRLSLRLIREGKLTKKVFLIDQAVKKRREFISILGAVLFLPDDTRIITGSPQRRRNFFDEVLGRIDWRYWRSLSLYRKALRQRNRLLDKIRQGQATASELFYWDQALAKNGEYLLEKRREFALFVERFFRQQKHQLLSTLSLSYLPSPVTVNLLASCLSKDLQFGWTSIGPHKDDFCLQSQQFRTPDKNLAFWGSRAQHRLGVLGLRLAEISFLEKKDQKKPVLLLDDIFSELDDENRELIVPLLKRYQVIVTAAQLEEKLALLFEKILKLPL
jgi:DNA replication and repair protein RecF